ncbi:hypothetical protein [Endozoicomonas sp. ALC066]|uniref:hypothetical protein n=1 Tax=Endozoicomonas sp. ALC066 TaxID=3403078 RepID=UPI003BB6CBE7
MAEFFETGSATDVNDLLTRVQTVLTSNGYTLQQSGSEGTGRRVHLSKGDLYINLRSGVNNEDPISNSGFRWTTAWNWNRYKGNPRVYYSTDWLAVNVGSGFDDSEDWREWYNQPGVQIEVAGNKGKAQFLETHGAIPKYWMFLQDNPSDAFWLIVEWAPGRYSWLAFGNVQKSSSYNGGRFYGASRWINDHYGYPHPLNSCQVQVLDGDFKDENNGWGRTDVSAPNKSTGSSNVIRTPYIPNYQFYSYSSSYPQHAQYNILYKSYIKNEARSVLYPIYGFVQRSSGYSLLGTLPNAFYTSLEPFVAGDSIDIGGESYLVFPFYDRGSPWVYAQDTSGSASDWDSYKVYHFGMGMAIRRPA